MRKNTPTSFLIIADNPVLRRFPVDNNMENIDFTIHPADFPHAVCGGSLGNGITHVLIEDSPVALMYLGGENTVTEEFTKQLRRIIARVSPQTGHRLTWATIRPNSRISAASSALPYPIKARLNLRLLRELYKARGRGDYLTIANILGVGSGGRKRKI